MTREFIDALKGKLHFDSPQLTFCTQYSWFGVAKDNRLGLESLYLIYNRVPALLSPGFLTFTVEDPHGAKDRQKRRQDMPLSIEEKGDYGFSGITSFAAPDILCYHTYLKPASEASGVRAKMLIPHTEPALPRKVEYDAVTKVLKVEALKPGTDKRDPDPDHPLKLVVVIPEAFDVVGVNAGGRDAGTDGVETDGDLEFTFYAPADKYDMAEQSFIIGIGEGPSVQSIDAKVARVGPVDSKTTHASSEAWLKSALGFFSFDGIPDDLRTHYAKSAYQILCNTKTPRGKIQGYAVFPSRGTYSAHYLWDACFTDLGVSQFNRQLAEDYLLALCENQEEDGKIPQFISATWNRPDESQPPLVGWAAWRLYEELGSKELLRAVYRPLSRMVDWWFNYRDDDGDGVVEYQHRLESGWDNAPRFERGRIAAVDLNAYLNQEMRVLSRIAAVFGALDESNKWKERATEHSKNMMARLFDREDGLFYDRLVETDRLWKVLTPASFTPLWTGVDVPDGTAHDMIVKYLINPRHFFGARPFPVVAYSDKHYEPENWWRGPVWLNIAWIMTEILKKYGFEKEYKEAVSRLVDMMLQSDELYELYSSSAGKPLGAAALCWTCAIFMDFARKMGSMEE